MNAKKNVCAGFLCCRLEIATAMEFMLLQKTDWTVLFPGQGETNPKKTIIFAMQAFLCMEAIKSNPLCIYCP